MYPPKPISSKVAMTTLSTILILVSVTANGIFLALPVRFKMIRTVPNILIANLALVDLLNVAINMPVYIIYTALEASWFRGKTLAILSTLSNRVFSWLNLTSRVLMMADLFHGIAFDMRYLVWKTNKKALVAVVLLWLANIVLGLLSCVPLLEIELGDAHVIEYRLEIYKQAKPVTASVTVLFVFCATILGVLTCYSIRRQKKKRAQLNLPPLQSQARLQTDIKATKTIAISVAAHFVCYIPAVVYAAFGIRKKDLADSWFGFVTWSSLFIPGIINPTLNFLRSGLFRSALKQFFKDPFGKSGFEEKANGNNDENRKNADLLRKKADEQTANSQDTFEPKATRNGEMQGEGRHRRNGIMPSEEDHIPQKDRRSSCTENGHMDCQNGEVSSMAIHADVHVSRNEDRKDAIKLASSDSRSADRKVRSKWTGRVEQSTTKATEEVSKIVQVAWDE